MDPRKTSAEWFRNQVFRDEAIKLTPVGRDLPEPLLTARRLEKEACHGWQARQDLFLEQARLLVDYEDEYGFETEPPPPSFASSYPTYQLLSDQRLRCYFSWRTSLRQGNLEPPPADFALLHIFELLNQVGVSDPLDGYHKLEQFRDSCVQTNAYILNRLKYWLKDYAVYYDLDSSLLDDIPQAVFNRSVAALNHAGQTPAEELIEAVRHLAHGWLETSKFYRAQTADMDVVIVRVLRRACEHYASRCKKSMVEQYFGAVGKYRAYPFEGAVFCDPLKRKDYRYTAGEQWEYICENGYWSVVMREMPNGDNRKLRALLKTIDSVMRQQWGFGHPVKAEMKTKWLLQIIHEEVQGLLAEKKAAEERKVTINFGQLTRIRQDAALTQEKLVVEEELDVPEEPVRPAEAEPPRLPEGEEDAEGGLSLGDAERRLLRCLLYGEDTGWVRAEGLLESVLVDGINEKLYDLFQDCVLDDSLQVVEDYADDLKEMVHP